ncbi:hypothetical protein Btru_066226 [Bulinus truncatus]|nr:hypothetical protein Btru_066226 [Bulinus truncatus]
MALVQLLGKTVTSKSGEVDVASLSENDVVGLYFSAHWCPPCRGFTPELANYYQKLRSAGKKFEIVFISSDRDAQSCHEYYNSMPWLLLPYDERDIKHELAENYNIRGIPTLVLVDPKTGDTISLEGRKIVTTDTEGADFPWKGLLLFKLYFSSIVEFFFSIMYLFTLFFFGRSFAFLVCFKLNSLPNKSRKNQLK